MCRKALPAIAGCPWMSKSRFYENPYTVIGSKAKAGHRLKGST
jgi:hypothetical protein